MKMVLSRQKNDVNILADKAEGGFIYKRINGVRWCLASPSAIGHIGKALFNKVSSVSGMEFLIPRGQSWSWGVGVWGVPRKKRNLISLPWVEMQSEGGPSVPRPAPGLLVTFKVSCCFGQFTGYVIVQDSTPEGRSILPVSFEPLPDKSSPAQTLL